MHKYYFEKLLFVVKNPEKLNCSYGKVSHDLKVDRALSKIIFLLI